MPKYKSTIINIIIAMTGIIICNNTGFSTESVKLEVGVALDVVFIAVIRKGEF